MIIAYPHSKGDLRPFTIKKGKNSLFLIIFMIKTVGGMYIPPGISISICGNENLQAEIEIPDLTE